MARERNSNKKNYVTLYSGHKSDKHENGTGFYISRHIIDNLLYSEPVNERIRKIKVRFKYYIWTLISIHAPNEGKKEVDKEKFYSSLEKVCDAVPNYEMKTELGHFNAEGGKSPIYIQPSRRHK